MWVRRGEQSRNRYGSWARLKKLKSATRVDAIYIVQTRICTISSPVVVHVSYNAMAMLTADAVLAAASDKYWYNYRKVLALQPHTLHKAMPPNRLSTHSLASSMPRSVVMNMHSPGCVRPLT
jgi:hypothetical protein